MRHQIRPAANSADRTASARHVADDDHADSQHERIKTTEAKAKFVRSDVEKLITLAKHG